VWARNEATSDVDQLQTYYKSAPWQVLNDLRAKAHKVHRQFIVEARAN